MKNTPQDLTGKVFGYLTVLESTGEKSPTSGYIWKCLCECGAIVEVRAGYLTRGDTKSCGCRTSYLNSKNNGGTGIAGESTIFERSIRDTPEYKNWMLLCLKRSKYKSELSGVTGKLEVHHKNSVSYLIKTLNITRLTYKDCKELYETSNGVVITKEEHKLFHKNFGAVTTEEMWNLFENDKDSYLATIDRPITKKRELHFNEFAGKVIGSLTLIEETAKATCGNSQYKCLCSCGNECIYQLSDLKKKDWTNIKTCGKCTRIRKDLTGQVFGYLTVVKLAHITDKHKAVYTCLCSCGKEKEIDASSLVRGKSTSCGCGKFVKTGPKAADLCGKIFGELTIISRDTTRAKPYFLCKCSCGVEKSIAAGSLTRKNKGTKSCGKCGSN